QLGTDQTMSFPFQYVGTKYVRLAVHVALVQTASLPHSVEVGAPLAPNPTPTPSPTPTPAPTASFTYSPSTPVTGQPVSFDGTASSCAAGPCSYAWTDYVYVSQLGTGPTMSFTFQYVGTKYVRLTVTDALGQTARTDH